MSREEDESDMVVKYTNVEWEGKRQIEKEEI